MLLTFRFHGELNDFLSREHRSQEFAQAAGGSDTLKHIIESSGVPHTEIGRVTVNGKAVAVSAIPDDGDIVEVFPFDSPVLVDDLRFVLDGHLGRLAAYLRMLGFDTWYERYADDPQLASVASGEGRILLTRDVGLLKRREVQRGYWVRAHNPQVQLKEVAIRFALSGSMCPFQRCMDCNGRVLPVPKNEVADLLPPHTRATKNDFSRCQQCGKVFWKGSHYERMTGWISQLPPPHRDAS